jgi:hypothetical protein
MALLVTVFPSPNRSKLQLGLKNSEADRKSIASEFNPGLGCSWNEEF